MTFKAQIISGSFAELIARQKAGESLKLGELLVCDNQETNEKILVQVFDLQYGSQISQQNLELISGMHLEENEKVEFLEPHLRNYSLAKLKSILSIKGNNAVSCKTMPAFFSTARSVVESDFSFLQTPSAPMMLGKLRSGDESLDVNIALNAEDAISHHVLIPATTGKGKSNLMKYLLWNLVNNEKVGILVLDPHDEYYGRNRFGLKDCGSNVIYYTAEDVPVGARTLKINVKHLKPSHFSGVADLSSAQSDAIYAYHNKFGDEWILEIVKGTLMTNVNEVTLGVLQRKMSNLLGLDFSGSSGKYLERGVFAVDSGLATLGEIVKEVEIGKVVIVDTSALAGPSELLVSSIITSAVYDEHKRKKKTGELKNAPVVGIVLEEAPRVLGKEVLEKGHNVFSTIAREGRKFKVGLLAITQLPSLIPREILANMNTKIILGLEMAQERQAIIDSSAQDLSTDARTIASLDKGEAIVSSNFARFAIPVKIPFFDDYEKKKEKPVRMKF